VTIRVHHIGPAAEHCKRGRKFRQRALMSRSIDAQGAARYDRCAGLGKPTSEVLGSIASGASSGPSTHHREDSLSWLRKPARTPEDLWRGGDEPKRRGKLRIVAANSHGQSVNPYLSCAIRANVLRSF
jgi:hypothetical protein